MSSVLTWLWPLLRRYGLPIVAVALAAWWLYSKGYAHCQTAETVKTLTTIVEIQHAQQQAYATAPRSRADVIERLRDGRF